MIFFCMVLGQALLLAIFVCEFLAANAVSSTAHALPRRASAPLDAASTNKIATGTSTAASAQVDPGGAGAKIAQPVIAQTLLMTTSTEVLQVSKIVLEHTRDHIDEMRHFMFGSFAAILGIAAFFGYHGFKDIIDPINQSISDLKIATTKQAEESLQKFIIESQEISHINGKALAALPIAMILIDDAEKLERTNSAAARAGLRPHERSVIEKIYQEIASTIDEVLSENHSRRLDPYVAGLLLMRKAYAIKRLNNFDGAFVCSSEAIKLNGDKTKASWYYNHACYAATSQHFEECFSSLRTAIKLDHRNRADAVGEKDFKTIQQDPRFEAVVKGADS